MSQSELRNFEKSMAYHLAPAMLGIKPACLMSMEKISKSLVYIWLGDSEDINDLALFVSVLCGRAGRHEENVELFNGRAYTKGMKLTVLCECKSRKLLFLYNEKLLSDRLADNRVRKLLESFGYDSHMTLEQQLERLSGRISASEDFPHEIGLFLGYPVDDVTGFIQNKGRNYLLCGYWKVYSDENRARRIFSNYDKCRNYLCNKLAQGESIYQALKIS